MLHEDLNKLDDLEKVDDEGKEKKRKKALEYLEKAKERAIEGEITGKPETRVKFKEKTYIITDEGKVVKLQDKESGRLTKVAVEMGEKIMKGVIKLGEKSARRIEKKSRKLKKVSFEFPKRERVTQEWIRKQIGTPEKKEEKVLFEIHPINFNLPPSRYFKEYPKDEYGRPLLLADLKKYDEKQEEIEPVAEVSFDEFAFSETGDEEQTAQISKESMLLAGTAISSDFGESTSALLASEPIVHEPEEPIYTPSSRIKELITSAFDHKPARESTILDNIIEHFRRKQEFEEKKKLVKQLLGLKSDAKINPRQPGELMKTQTSAKPIMLSNVFSNSKNKTINMIKSVFKPNKQKRKIFSLKTHKKHKKARKKKR